MFKNNMYEFHFIIQITECAIYQIKHRPSLTLLLIPLRLGFLSITLKWKILHWALISQDQSKTSTISLYRSTPTSQQHLLMKT